MKLYPSLQITKLATLIIFFVSFLLLTGEIFSQQLDAQLRLAENLEKNYDYDSALTIYQRLYVNDKYNPRIIEGVKRCNFALHKYEEQIAFLEEVIKYYKQRNTWRIDLAEAYFLNNQKEKAIEIWWEYINLHKNNINTYRQVAQSMLSQRSFDEAINVYLSALQNMKDQYHLHIDIGNLYKARLEYGKAARHYLEYFIHNHSQQAFIQQQILNLTSKDQDIQPVITEIKKFIDKHPDQKIMHEILAGIYLKEKEYDRAFNIYQNLDNDKPDARYLRIFASEALKNKAFEFSLNANQKIISQFPKSPYINQAKFDIGLAHISLAYDYQKNSYHTQAVIEIQKAIASFENLISTSQDSRLNFLSLINLGDIYSNFYLDMDQAIAYYKQVISKYPRDANLDKVKIILGDAYLSKNQLNLAKDAYNSVYSNNYKNLAEFKKSELEFFLGNFKQSLETCNRLILQMQPTDSLFNNILSRQIFISNFSEDSISLAEYSNAELLLFQRKLTESIERLSKLALNNLKLSAVAGIKAGKILIRLAKFEQSRDLLSKLREMYPEDKHIDEIIFLLAQCEEKLANHNNALKLYQEILTNHSNSLFLQQAREKARILNEKTKEISG